MVGCVLALLAGVVLLLIPLVLEHSWRSLVLAIRSLPLAGTVLPRPRPPSLLVLSISRTWFAPAPASAGARLRPARGAILWLCWLN